MGGLKCYVWVLNRGSWYAEGKENLGKEKVRQCSEVKLETLFSLLDLGMGEWSVCC